MHQPSEMTQTWWWGRTDWMKPSWPEGEGWTSPPLRCDKIGGGGAGCTNVPLDFRCHQLFLRCQCMTPVWNVIWVPLHAHCGHADRSKDELVPWHLLVTDACGHYVDTITSSEYKVCYWVWCSCLLASALLYWYPSQFQQLSVSVSWNCHTCIREGTDAPKHSLQPRCSAATIVFVVFDTVVHRWFEPDALREPEGDELPVKVCMDFHSHFEINETTLLQVLCVKGKFIY